MVVANKDNSIKINKDEYSFGDQMTDRHPNGTLPVLKNGKELKRTAGCVRANKIVVKEENGQNKIYFILERDSKNPWCIITDSKDFNGGINCIKKETNKRWENFYLFHYKNKNDLPTEFM